MQPGKQKARSWLLAGGEGKKPEKIKRRKKNPNNPKKKEEEKKKQKEKEKKKGKEKKSEEKGKEKRNKEKRGEKGKKVLCVWDYRSSTGDGAGSLPWDGRCQPSSRLGVRGWHLPSRGENPASRLPMNQTRHQRARDRQCGVHMGGSQSLFCQNVFPGVFLPYQT